MRIVASLLISAAASLAAAAVRAETLNDALIAAYLNNPDLEAERAALRATDTRVAQARAGYYPNLTATLQGQLTRGSQTSAFTFPSAPGFDFSTYEDILETQDADSTIATLALKQNLYSGGGTKAKLAGAETRVRSGQANLISVEQSTLLSAAQAYIATWRDRALMEEAEANLARFTRQLQGTRRRLDLGEIAPTDLTQAEARRSRARADRDQARADLAESEATYEQVIGPLEGTLTAPWAISDLPADLDEAYALAEANPDIQRARLDFDAAKTDVDSAFAGLLPSIDLVGQLNYANDPNPEFYDQNSVQIGVTLTVPLFQGGAATARVRESNQTVRQRQSQQESVANRTRRDVRTYWTAIDAAHSAVEAYEMEAKSNELALRGVERESNLGLRTVQDVLDAQQDLFQSRSNLVKARADAVSASFRLKSAVGQLTVASLALAVQPYDADQNYRVERERLFGVGD